MSIRMPSLNEIKAAGYDVKISHKRRVKVAYTDNNTGKIVVKVVLKSLTEMETDFLGNSHFDSVLTELLPKGGKTEVIIADTKTQVDFYASATCMDTFNYNKKEGINRALGRVILLMLVCNDKDGFEMRLNV